MFTFLRHRRDDAAAQADLAVVQHGRLAGGDGPLRLRGAVQGETGAVGLRQLRGRIGLAVAGFAAVGAQRRGVAGDPAGLVGLLLQFCMAQQVHCHLRGWIGF